MTTRITNRDLQNLVDDLNRVTKKRNAYLLDYAYGGVKLAKTVPPSTGQTNISSGGYGTKKELYYSMLLTLNVLHEEKPVKR